ncbi:hypothetical protein L6452_43115 [Arctium lappa]|uniref:Uncharacterized protein n=1 Tax=Arctium lappa TaxID=4217 RepID=A0ACB8XLD0_ARCLA|nr:hypothetical protein L6452_43115 [Arctium lappa]
MDHKFKSKWEISKNLIFDHKDYNNVYDEVSWRQRNFMCNFCKKEYKSAQALGGHMNVHRRDRARLRLSSPSHHDHHPPNPNPNPNPNFSLPPPSSSSSMWCLPYKTCYHSCLFSPSSSTISKEGKQEMMFPLVPHSARNLVGDMKKKKMKMKGSSAANVSGGNFHGNCVDERSEIGVWKKREAFGVEMKMGNLVKDGKINGMDLDLELRLGRSESI